MVWELSIPSESLSNVSISIYLFFFIIFTLYNEFITDITLFHHRLLVYPKNKSVYSSSHFSFATTTKKNTKLINFNEIQCRTDVTHVFKVAVSGHVLLVISTRSSC